MLSKALTTDSIKIKTHSTLRFLFFRLYFPTLIDILDFQGVILKPGLILFILCMRWFVVVSLNVIVEESHALPHFKGHLGQYVSHVVVKGLIASAYNIMQR